MKRTTPRYPRKVTWGEDMSRSRARWRARLALALSICCAGAAISLIQPAHAATKSILVAAPFKGWTEPIFLDTSITIVPGTGSIYLSGSEDGSEPLWVDDAWDVTITHLDDGSTEQLNHDFSEGCSGEIKRSGPFNIPPFLHPGNNTIRIILKDICGFQEGNSPIWLVGNFEVTGTRPSYRDTIQASKPSAYWPLDETDASAPVRDVIGGLNGVASSSVERGVSGIDERPAARLTSACDAIDLTAHTDAFTPRNAFTIEAWIRPDNNVTKDQLVIGWRAAGWQVRLDSGRVKLVVRTGGGKQQVRTRFRTPPSDSYHHIGVTKQNNRVSVYIDGRPEVRGVLTTRTRIAGREMVYPSRARNRRIAIGDNVGGACSGFTGEVDEVAFYSRALGPSDIASHYDAAVPSLQALGGGSLLNFYPTDNGASEQCTAGFAVQGPNEAKLILTARHCWPGAPKPLYFTPYPFIVYNDGAGRNPRISDVIANCDTDENCLVRAWIENFDALAFQPLTRIDLTPIVTPPDRSRPPFKIRGVVRPGEPGDRIGDRVCLYGRTTGTRCGEIAVPPPELRSPRQYFRFVHLPAEGGDSGGSVVTDDGTARAAGITIGNGAGVGYPDWALYISIGEVEKRLGVQVLTEP